MPIAAAPSPRPARASPAPTARAFPRGNLRRCGLSQPGGGAQRRRHPGPGGLHFLNFRSNCPSPSRVKENGSWGHTFCACTGWLSLSPSHGRLHSLPLFTHDFPSSGEPLPKAHTNLNLALAAPSPWIWASETLLSPTRVGRRRGWQLRAARPQPGRVQAPRSGRLPGATASFCTICRGPLSSLPKCQGPDDELSPAALVRAAEGPQPLGFITLGSFASRRKY